jgi:hypothetical protein
MFGCYVPPDVSDAMCPVNFTEWRFRSWPHLLFVTETPPDDDERCGRRKRTGTKETALPV